MGIGPLDCPPGSGLTIVGDADGGFTAHKERGKIDGHWVIEGVATAEGDDDDDTELVYFDINGLITGGRISSQHYTLTGVMTNDEVCQTGASPNNPISITFTGECGDNVVITFKSSASQEARLNGDVDC